MKTPTKIALPTLLANLETEIPFEIIEIEAGEDAKTIATTTQLWEILAEFKADRKSSLLNLGGGVITDMEVLWHLPIKEVLNF